MKTDKTYIKAFLFSTIVLLLSFTKGEAGQSMVMFYKTNDWLGFWVGLIGIGSAVAGWVAIGYYAFIRPNK